MVPLSNVFNNPLMIYTPGQLDRFLVGLATQPRQKFDNVVSEQLTNHLFQGEARYRQGRSELVISREN